MVLATALAAAPVRLEDDDGSRRRSDFRRRLSGRSVMDILGNVIPHIGGEEEKIETETCKILGASRTAKRSFCGVRVSDNATV